MTNDILVNFNDDLMLYNGFQVGLELDPSYAWRIYDLQKNEVGSQPSFEKAVKWIGRQHSNQAATDDHNRISVKIMGDVLVYKNFHAIYNTNLKYWRICDDQKHEVCVVLGLDKVILAVDTIEANKAKRKRFG